MDVPRIVSEESVPAAWQVSYAISLWYQKPRLTTVWLKWPISFYSGKDLCTEGEFQLLLYSTRTALPTLPIDGCHKGLTLHHPLKPCHSCNSGDKCYCQNNKSFFVHRKFQGQAYPGKNQANLSYYLQTLRLELHSSWLHASPCMLAVSTTRPYLMHTTNF